MLLKSTLGCYVTSFLGHLSECHMFSPPAGPTSGPKTFSLAANRLLWDCYGKVDVQASLHPVFASTVDERRVQVVLVNRFTDSRDSRENESSKCVHRFDSEAA